MTAIIVSAVINSHEYGLFRREGIAEEAVFMTIYHGRNDDGGHWNLL